MPSRAVFGHKVRQASDVDSLSADMFVERINRGVKRGRAWWYVDATSGREDVFVCVQGRGLSSVGHARTRLFDHKKILRFPFLLSLLLSVVGISPQQGCQSFSFIGSSRNTSASLYLFLKSHPVPQRKTRIRLTPWSGGMPVPILGGITFGGPLFFYDTKQCRMR